MMISLNDYQSGALETAIYGGVVDCNSALTYCLLGLAGEAGECCNKWKKHLRDSPNYEATREQLRDELGDVLWYLAAACHELNISLGDVAQRNLSKLKRRQATNRISGSGDDR